MRGSSYKRKLNTGYSFPRFCRESFYLKFDYFFATLKALFLIFTGYEVVKEEEGVFSNIHVYTFRGIQLPQLWTTLRDFFLPIFPSDAFSEIRLRYEIRLHLFANVRKTYLPTLIQFRRGVYGAVF